MSFSCVLCYYLMFYNKSDLRSQIGLFDHLVVALLETVVVKLHQQIRQMEVTLSIFNMIC